VGQCGHWGLRCHISPGSIEHDEPCVGVHVVSVASGAPGRSSPLLVAGVYDQQGK